MQQVSLKELLAPVDKKEHPDWLTIWEKESVDYLVAYRNPKGESTLRAVGPYQKIKTLAKAIAEKKHGFPQAYTPSLAFSIRALEYKRQELEDQIAIMQERESELQRRWEAAPQQTPEGAPATGDLSLRERDIQRRERELESREKRLQEQQQRLENEAKFVGESEEQLSRRFQEFMEREAAIEQREEDLQQKAFRLGLAQ